MHLTSGRRITHWLMPYLACLTLASLQSAPTSYQILTCAVIPTGSPLMAILKDRQRRLQRAALAPTTRNSRLSQMNCYISFCGHYGLTSFPCSPEQACLFAAYLSEWMIPSSIINYLSAVWYKQLELGHESHASSFIVHQTIRGLRRCHISNTSPRYPLAVTDLNLLFSELNLLLPSDLAFWGAITLALRALLRESHFTISRHSLKWADVTLYPDHLILLVRSSKTNQFSAHPHRIVLNASLGSDLCPVRWLYALSRAHHPLESDFIFRTPTTGGLSRFSATWFNQRLKSLSAKVGLNSTHISSHSLRHGGASYMSALGCDIADIRAWGSWASSAIFRYLHHSDETLRSKDLTVSTRL